jgi:hypothetical protein
MAGALWVTNSSFQASTKLLDEKYKDELSNVPPQYSVVINEYTPKDRKRYVQMLPYTGLGNFVQKGEGEAPTFDSPNEMIPFTAIFSTYALAAAVSREATVEDPLDILGELPSMMAKSARNTKDLLAVAMLNLGFSAVKPLPDGQPLFSTAHVLNPIVTPTGVVSRIGQTFSNSLGNTQPTPESIRGGELLFETILDDRGKKEKRTPTTLVFHPQMSQLFEEITGTPTAPYENTRKVNIQYNKWKLFAWRDLSNPYAWFMLGDKGKPSSDCHGLTVWFRWQSDFDSFRDPMTKNRIVTDSFRMAQGAWTWRGAVGSQGSGAVAF